MAHSTDNHDQPPAFPGLPAARQDRCRRILALARSISALDGLDPDQRRRKLLRKVAHALSPTQYHAATAHCEEVARFASRLAERLRLDPPARIHARHIALLHDIGKIIYPQDLPITAAISAAICEALGVDEPISRAVAQHHARFDAPQPPAPAARIVAVAHTLATHAADTPRSPAQALTRALAHLRLRRGTLYDPDIVIAAHMLAPSAMTLAA
jgi:putative nucleotidyltransferase with HDIG domain